MQNISFQLIKYENIDHHLEKKQAIQGEGNGDNSIKLTGKLHQHHSNVCKACFTSAPLRPLCPLACQMCPPSSLVPFTFTSLGSPCNLIHAGPHNTLHGTQSQWYRTPLFHSLHLSLLFLRSLFALPLYAWVIPNWASNWNGNHPCIPVT